MILLLIGFLIKFLLNFSFSSADEVKEWTELDLPILRYRRFLESKGWWNMEMDKQWLSKVFLFLIFIFINKVF